MPPLRVARGDRGAIARRLLLALLAGVVTSAAASDDLLSILAEAETMDPFYREAQSNALAVAEGVPQARASLYLPQLSGNASTSRVSQDTELQGAFGVGGTVDFPQYSFLISLRQPIYHQARLIALEQADKRLQQAQLQVLAAYQDMMLRVSERYFNVLAAQDNLAFALAETESLKSQLEQAQQRFEVGLIAITDVQEAQAGYDRAVADEISARNLIENTYEALREITGTYHQDLAVLGDEVPLNLPDPQDIDAWTQSALDNNLDLSAALVASDVAQQEIRRQFAGHFPTLDVVGSHGYNETGGRFGTAEATQSEIGVELNVPLYEGGTRLSLTRQAGHEYESALERVEQVRRSVQREAREAYLGVSARIGSVKARRQAVISSRTALDSTRAGFEVGTRTAIDVIAAERALSQAKRDFARARYDYILDTLRLKRAAGSLQPEDLAVANTWLVEAPAAPAEK